MSTFIKSLVMQKIKQLTPAELLSYADQYGFSITDSEADSIVTYVKSHPLDPFDSNDRMKMLQELTRITDANTAKKAQKLFNELIKSYGLGHLFT